jgi:hypothetical protein
VLTGSSRSGLPNGHRLEQSRRQFGVSSQVAIVISVIWIACPIAAHSFVPFVLFVSFVVPSFVVPFVVVPSVVLPFLVGSAVVSLTPPVFQIPAFAPFVPFVSFVVPSFVVPSVVVPSVVVVAFVRSVVHDPHDGCPVLRQLCRADAGHLTEVLERPRLPGGNRQQGPIVEDDEGRDRPVSRFVQAPRPERLHDVHRGCERMIRRHGARRIAI